MTRGRALGSVALGVSGLAVLAAAGCSSGSGSGSSLPAVTTVPVHSQSSNSASASQSNSAPASSPTPTTKSPTSSPKTSAAHPQAAACSTAQLSLSLGQPQGNAGSFDTPVVLTNTSSGACTLTGYPGVSFIDSSGKQLGPDAARRGGVPPKTVTLAGSGGTASALLHQPDPSVFSPDQCKPAKAKRLRVYPPNQFTPLTVSDNVTVCTGASGRAVIGPMEAGASPS